VVEVIVDAHHHLVAGGVSRYPWLRELDEADARKAMPSSGTNYLVDAYLGDFAELSLAKSVHVQAEWDHADPVGETRWLQSVASCSGFPHAIVAYADLAAPDVEATLAAHAEFPLVRGIRQIVAWHKTERRSFASHPGLLLDDTWQRGYSLCGRYGFSFDLQCYPEQMNEAFQIARKFPDIQLVVNHCGMPGDDLDAWSLAMRQLARAENVAVKMSRFATADPHWTADSIRPCIRRTIEIFGVERCMFASNFPFDGINATATALFDAYDLTVSDLSVAERNALFSANAVRVYRL
jgi:predicted TIM-barrel fold metal-dependent hydrolase